MSNVRRIGTSKKNIFARHARLQKDILSLPTAEKLRLAADFLDRASERVSWGEDALAVAKRAVFEIEGAMAKAEAEVAAETEPKP